MSVRDCTFADWPQVDRLARAFHAHRPVAAYEVRAFQRTFDNLLAQPNGFAAILDDGQGVILAAAMQSPFSHEIVTQEIMWFCEAKGRGMDLVNAYAAWAKRIGAKHCLATCLDERVANLFRRQGFQPYETSYRVF